MKYLLFALPLLLALKCETDDVEAGNKLSGEWLVREVFLGDMIDTPCGFEVTDAPQLIIEFSKNSDDGKWLKFSGQSAINSFFGTYQITSFDETTGVGQISFGAIASTKKGGSEELMACENRFFDLLNRTSDFSITIQNGKEVLNIGVFKKDDQPSRDGGTFFILGRV